MQYMKFTRRTSGIKLARNVFKRAREDPRSGHHVCLCVFSLPLLLPPLPTPSHYLLSPPSTYTYTYIIYYHNKLNTSQVFVAAALMEYYISKDKNIAFKIFELGLKRYSDEPSYLLAYIDHLSHLNGEDHLLLLHIRVYMCMYVCMYRCTL